MPYCIYTDREVEAADGSVDHVIPLSLGGRNNFCVFAERIFNNDTGSRVDSGISNDPIYMFARREADIRGHSKAKPIPLFKSSTVEGRPAQISFTREELQIWDARERRLLTEEEKIGKELTSRFTVDAFAPIRFMAKVVLGGGYFIYGDHFKQMVDCNVLRELMRLNVYGSNSWAKNADHVSICDTYHPDSQNKQGEGYVRRQLCEFTKRSVFISEYYKNATSFHVGVLGMYVGSMTFEHENIVRSEDDEMAKGYGLLLAPGAMERITFQGLCESWWRQNVGPDIPRADTSSDTTTEQSAISRSE